jgi:hypothetical protein
MVRQTRQAVAGFPNAHIFCNNGRDLSVVRRHWWDTLGISRGLQLDFAFSCLVFQHIPSREVIENYVSEVSRLLRPGALFKFQVQGYATRELKVDESWVGYAFSQHEARKLAESNGFEMRYDHGAGGQYYWLWFFKK